MKKIPSNKKSALKPKAKTAKAKSPLDDVPFPDPWGPMLVPESEDFNPELLNDWEKKAYQNYLDWQFFKAMMSQP